MMYMINYLIVVKVISLAFRIALLRKQGGVKVKLTFVNPKGPDNDKRAN
jgi:hypothetical protein